MGIEVKNSEVILRAVKERIDRMRSRLPQVLADEAARIVTRTRKGVDVDGNPFADYTPRYAKSRRRKGRKVSPVDLTFSGDMLNAITTEVREEPGKTVGTIFFNSAREAGKARGNQEKRRFFGLSDEQVERIKKRLQSDD